MSLPKILVTGATGKTGAATTIQLLKQGYPVRALVHRHDQRSEWLKNAGAEIKAGSLEDIADLRTSMVGIQRAYFCPPLDYGTLRRAMLFAVAAQEAKLEVVVALSQWLSDPLHPAIHSREKWLTERLLTWLPGVDVVTVNPGFFADNYFVGLEAMVHFGLMAMPLGDGLNAPPSNEDIARVIVGALTNPAPHVGKTYRPTGPQLLAPEEIAATIGKLLGRKVKYRNASMTLFLKVAKSLAIPDYVIEELSWFLRDYQRNSFGVGAPTDAVLSVGGSPPEAFEDIARRYVAASRFGQPTIGSRLLAIRNLGKGLLTTSPDPESIARRLGIPRIAHATLAADSMEWLNSHSGTAIPHQRTVTSFQAARAS
jgi:NAD(P)H dehydrogenase (quinone)